MDKSRVLSDSTRSSVNQTAIPINNGGSSQSNKNLGFQLIIKYEQYWLIIH